WGAGGRWRMAALMIGPPFQTKFEEPCMEPLLIGILGIVLLLVFIAARFPLGSAMGLVGFLGILMIIGVQPAIGVAKAVPYELVGDWNLSAVPMFLLMGYFASAAGLTRGLFRAARIFLGRIPGGLRSEERRVG